MKLSGYIDVLLHEMNQFIIRLERNTDENDIHDLRVTHKELFALYKILKIGAPEFANYVSEDIKLLKKIFKKTGEIRDRHIILNLIPQIVPYGEYGHIVEVVSKELNSMEKNLPLSFTDYSFSVMRGHLFHSFSGLDEMDKEVLYKNIMSKSRDFNNSIQAEASSQDVDYHKIRKYVKQQFYILEMFNKLFQTKRNVKVVAKLKKMGKVLGEWHDLIILKDFLKENFLEVYGNYFAVIDKKAHDYIVELKREYLTVISKQ